MVTLKAYEAYLRVKRIIDSCDEAEIISDLSNERNYSPMITESEGISPTKCYSTSAAARHWCTFQILGGGGDNSIQFINIGRVGDKNLKNCNER